MTTNVTGNDSDNDNDNDGIDDAYSLRDSDGIPNTRDIDSDGDGIADRAEGTGDANRDGIPDYLDKPGKLETATHGAGSLGGFFI